MMYRCDDLDTYRAGTTCLSELRNSGARILLYLLPAGFTFCSLVRSGDVDPQYAALVCLPAQVKDPLWTLTCLVHCSLHKALFLMLHTMPRPVRWADVSDIVGAIQWVHRTRMRILRSFMPSQLWFQNSAASWFSQPEASVFRAAAACR